MITHGNSYNLLKDLNILEEGEEINHVDKLHLIGENVKHNLELAYNKYKVPYNLRSRAINYNVGDVLYRRNFSLSKKSDNFNSKLAPKWIKCIVSKSIGNCYYQISDLNGNRDISCERFKTQLNFPFPDRFSIKIFDYLNFKSICVVTAVLYVIS